MYTTTEKVESHLGRALTEDEADLIDDVIETVSHSIDVYTGRSWLSVDCDGSETEERLYDGNGQKELFIDDFSDIESVKLLDYSGNISLELTNATDYILYPLNKTTKQSIRLRNYHFAEGAGNVIITAQFSSGDVPTPVITACTGLVANFLLSMGSTGLYKKETIEGYSYELADGTSDTDSQALLASLNGYKKLNL